MLMHADGSHDCLESSGLPLALMEEASYEETSAEIREGDSLLLFSDGALEVSSASGEMLGLDGLIGLLTKQGYPQGSIRMDVLEEDLLRYSNAIRLDDDLTLVEVRLGAMWSGSQRQSF